MTRMLNTLVTVSNKWAGDPSDNLFRLCYGRVVYLLFDEYGLFQSNNLLLVELRRQMQNYIQTD